MAAESPIAFPTSIGPFTMHSVGLLGAFNNFYTRHDFPRPDPASDENSMAGMDLGNMGIMDIVFCQLSPLHSITLDQEAKELAGIPRDASHFAFAYPAVLAGVPTERVHATEKAFLDFGGFVYFSSDRSLVGTKSIAPMPLGSAGIMFGRRQPLHDKVTEKLTCQGRFQEITLDALSEKGATHFAWIRPDEFKDHLAAANPNGCFAYKFADKPPSFFPVVDKPVFTPALLEEELEGGESWVVVRGAAPAIEYVSIFDKSCPLEENVERNDRGYNLNNDSQVYVTLGDEGQHFSYKEWQQSTEPGSLAQPWIFHVQ